ncbi:MAG: sulfite exporter TauE/SafE family protein [Candidatus Methanomethylophilaceae archaeon]
MIAGLLILGVLAGILGTLFGIGGGIVFIPILTIVYGLTTTEAAAVSLIGIIATSTSATTFYLQKRVTNIRLGLLLEISTAIGAMVGAFMSAYIQDWALMMIFAIVILVSALRMTAGREKEVSSEKGEFTYYDLKREENVNYDVKNIKSGFAACSIAGMVSSMTGIGGGVIKVPIMNLHMGVPVRAAMATSNYMIGITAFSGAIIYFLNGHVLLDVAAFVVIGAFLGSLVGERVSKSVDGSSLRKYFSILLIFVSIIMFLQAGGIL